MQSSHDEGFLDLLYSAAVEPDLWVPVMERFADILGGSGAWLSRISVADGSGTGIVARIDPDSATAYDQYYGSINPFSNEPDPETYMAGWKPKILTDRHWLPKDALLRNEYYNDFMRPQDIQSAMIIRLSAVGLEVSALTMNRAHSSEAFGPRDIAKARRYHGHLRRAFRLTGTLAATGLGQDDLEGAANRTGEAVFVLSSEGLVRRMNAQAERLLARRDDVKAIGGRLTIPHDSSGRLQALIAMAGSPVSNQRTGGSMTLQAGEARPPLLVTVAPARSDRLSVFQQKPAVIVCVAEPGIADEVHLTARERDALAWVAEGKSDWEIATILGLSETTVRFHVDNARKKLGAVNRAQAVARMLSPSGR
jgi:DNA-binding CsgD family transcriptional regulator